MTEADCKLDGYDTFKCNMNTNVGRGLIIYTKPAIDASQITSTSEFSEHLIIRIPLRGKDELTLVWGIALHKLLRDISNRSSHILITRDFNYRGINWIDWSIYENTMRNNCFMEMVRDVYPHQHVTVVTRFRVGQRTSMLDLILTNEENMVDNLEVHIPLVNSDHGCLKFHLVCCRERKVKPRKMYLYDEGKYSSLG